MLDVSRSNYLVAGSHPSNIRRSICLNEASPHYRRLVRPGICNRCKLSREAPPEKTVEAVFAEKTDEPQPPGLAFRVLTYTQAVAEWLAAGRPERSDEEIQRIYKEHCEPCSWRKRHGDICRGCGCRGAAYGMAVFNKIKMATQHCPRDKW